MDKFPEPSCQSDIPTLKENISLPPQPAFGIGMAPNVRFLLNQPSSPLCPPVRYWDAAPAKQSAPFHSGGPLIMDACVGLTPSPPA
jgi:hypothetical protein